MFTPSYYEVRKLPVHLLPLVVAKLWKLIEQDLLEHVPPGSSKWASPIVVLRKSKGDICICGDYKMGVNHKVCFESHPISNVEAVIHGTGRYEHFYKNRFENGNPPDTNRQLQRSNNDKYANRVTKMEKDAIWNKNSKWQVLGEDIRNIICCQDDICIEVTNENELKKKTDIILNRLRNIGMTINEKKKKIHKQS